MFPSFKFAQELYMLFEVTDNNVHFCNTDSVQDGQDKENKKFICICNTWTSRIYTNVN
jgi:hypothetical protein